LIDLFDAGDTAEMEKVIQANGELANYELRNKNGSFGKAKIKSALKMAADNAVMSEIYSEEYNALLAYQTKLSEKEEADKDTKEAQKKLDEVVLANMASCLLMKSNTCYLMRNGWQDSRRILMRRVYWNVYGRKEFVWRCVTRVEQGPDICKNRTVKEDELYDAVMTAINRLLAGGDKVISTLEENIHAVIGDTTEYQITEINKRLEEKQKQRIILANRKQDYEQLADEIDELREGRQTLLVEDASLSGENERIQELVDFIHKNKFKTLEYDDQLVRKIIQNVTVYEDHFLICFKSGIEMKI
jgi:hypothetical protein